MTALTATPALPEVIVSAGDPRRVTSSPVILRDGPRTDDGRIVRRGVLYRSGPPRPGDG